MSKDSIVIDRPGVYLFPSPTQITAQIDRELLVMFSMPMASACGIVLHDPIEAPRGMFEPLDTLWEKARKDFRLGDHQVTVKAFGLSRAQTNVVSGLMQWLSAHALHLGAKDLGRNVGRNLSIDCRTGKVAVSYAEAYIPGFPQFLSRGSARTRLATTNPNAANEVLVLSRNAVCRQLTLQAVEENKNWSASVPLHPDDMWSTKDYPYFPWSSVILFQDLEDEEGVVPWAKAIHKLYPNVQFCWVGTRIPEELSKLGNLAMISPLEPHALGEFKLNLSRFFTSGEGEKKREAEVIPFRKGRRAK